MEKAQHELSQVSLHEMNVSEPSDDISKVKSRRCQNQGMVESWDKFQRYLQARRNVLDYGLNRHPVLRRHDMYRGLFVEDGNLSYDQFSEVSGIVCTELTREVTSEEPSRGREYGCLGTGGGLSRSNGEVE